MRKFIMGLLIGVVISMTSVIYASDSIQAILWPVEIEMNGKPQQMSNDYAVLNYKGHAYVPVRYVAENLGLGVLYSSRDNLISIQSEPSDATEKTIWKMQYRLNTGQDKKYVKDLLGEPEAVKPGDEQKETWKYTVSAKVDYKFDNWLQFDMDGLEKGDLEAQLYIKWSAEGKVEQVSLAYAHTVNGKRWSVMHFIFPDGSSSGGIYE